MRLLPDQGLPRGAASIVREHGFPADHAGDAGLAHASDEEILAHARASGAVVVTLDADFHAILALSGATAPSVVRIRIEGLRHEALADLIERVLAAAASDLSAGAVVSVDARRVRIRRLPIGR